MASARPNPAAASPQQSENPPPATMPGLAFIASRLVIEPPMLVATVTVTGSDQIAEVPFDMRDEPGIASAVERLNAEVIAAGAQRMGSAQAEVMQSRQLALQARGALGALASTLARVTDVDVRSELQAEIDAVTALLARLG